MCLGLQKKSGSLSDIYFGILASILPDILSGNLYAVSLKILEGSLQLRSGWEHSDPVLAVRVLLRTLLALAVEVRRGRARWRRRRRRRTRRRRDS